MAYTAKLTKGSKSLLLDGSAGLALGLDFVPPSTQFENLIGSGTSANRYGGGSKFGEKAVNSIWEFSVKSSGSTVAICTQQLDRLAYFLQQAGDESEPLYFEWRPEAILSFEPLWGQCGANRRVEIVAVDSRGLWDEYLAGDVRSSVIEAVIGLQVKPFALGKQQRVASAKGAVIEDIIGTADGISRGLRVYHAYTNISTNPIFGNSTWNTGWTTSASVTSSANTDPNFVLFGTTSAKLVRSAATNTYEFYQPLTFTVATYHFSVYAKKPDGSAVTANDLRIFYDGAVATATYTSVGNGWYRLQASGTGAAVVKNVGVYVGVNDTAGTTVYIDGFQVSTSFGPLVYGDMLGCAWTGTAHASSSTATVAYCRLPAAGNIDTAQGTIRMVWRPDYANTVYDYDIYFFSVDTMFAYFTQADDKFNFYTTAATISSNAQTFAAGDSLILHFVWGPGSMKIYLNGAQIATGVNYTPPALGTYIYIGSDYTPGQHPQGVYRGFTVYNRAMTATEVTNDYNNLVPVMAGSRKIDSIPWLWVPDGDNQIDFRTTDTTSTYGIIGGIPGDGEAVTEYRIHVQYGYGVEDGLYLARTDINYDAFRKGTNLFYKFAGGTYAVGTYGVGTTEISGPTAYSIGINDSTKGWNGRQINYIGRMGVGTLGASLRGYEYADVSAISKTNWYNYGSCTTSTGFDIYYFGGLGLDIPQMALDASLSYFDDVGIGMKRASGSANIIIDYFYTIVGPVMSFASYCTGYIDHLNFQIKGRDIFTFADTLIVAEKVAPRGDIVNLMPEKINYLILAAENRSGGASYAGSIEHVKVEPRWITA